MTWHGINAKPLCDLIVAYRHLSIPRNDIQQKFFQSGFFFYQINGLEGIISSACLERWMTLFSNIYIHYVWYLEY